MSRSLSQEVSVLEQAEPWAAPAGLPTAGYQAQQGRPWPSHKSSQGRRCANSLVWMPMSHASTACSASTLTHTRPCSASLRPVGGYSASRTWPACPCGCGSFGYVANTALWQIPVSTSNARNTALWSNHTDVFWGTHSSPTRSVSLFFPSSSISAKALHFKETSCSHSQKKFWSQAFPTSQQCIHLHCLTFFQWKENWVSPSCRMGSSEDVSTWFAAKPFPHQLLSKPLPQPLTWKSTLQFQLWC